MASRGMFFALTGEQEAALMTTRDDAEVRAFVEEVEMGDWDGEPLDRETDKAWDAIHRCLGDGTLGCGRRLSPLGMAVLGGGHHYEGDDYIVAHLRAGEVAQVAAALDAVDEHWMRQGVAPDATLLNGKVLGDNGFGQESWIIAGMEWAVAQGARVVNMSLTGAPPVGEDPMSTALDRLTRQTGALFVVAAGNSGPTPGTVGSPATAPAALAVGAVDGRDAPADFSSRGPSRSVTGIKPDVTAPGVGVVSALAPGSSIALQEPVVDGHYVALNGTSMATPHVAGAAALLAGGHPDWRADRLKGVLMGTATATDGVSVYTQGAGRIDAARAVRSPLSVTPSSMDAGVAL